MLTVLKESSNRGAPPQPVATIYWVLDPEDKHPGPDLDMAPQIQFAPALLELLKNTAFADPNYRSQLEHHYHRVKAAVRDPSTKAHRAWREMEGEKY